MLMMHMELKLLMNSFELLNSLELETMLLKRSIDTRQQSVELETMLLKRSIDTRHQSVEEGSPTLKKKEKIKMRKT
jgi:hypothetical protein